MRTDFHRDKKKKKEKANCWINGSARDRRAGKLIDRQIIYVRAQFYRNLHLSEAEFSLEPSDGGAAPPPKLGLAASQEDNKPFKYIFNSQERK